MRCAKNGVDSGFGVSFVHHRPPNPPASPNPPSKVKIAVHVGNAGAREDFGRDEAAGKAAWLRAARAPGRGAGSRARRGLPARGVSWARGRGGAAGPAGAAHVDADWRAGGAEGGAFGQVVPEGHAVVPGSGGAVEIG